MASPRLGLVLEVELSCTYSGPHHMQMDTKTLKSPDIRTSYIEKVGHTQPQKLSKYNACLGVNYFILCGRPQRSWETSL